MKTILKISIKLLMTFYIDLAQDLKKLQGLSQIAFSQRMKRCTCIIIRWRPWRTLTMSKIESRMPVRLLHVNDTPISRIVWMKVAL